MAREINPRQFNQAPIPAGNPDLMEKGRGHRISEITGLYNSLNSDNTSLSILPHAATAKVVQEAVIAQNVEFDNRRPKSHILFFNFGESAKVDPQNPVLRGAARIDVAESNDFKPVALNIERVLRDKKASFESIGVDLRLSSRNDSFTEIAVDGINRSSATSIILGMGFHREAEETDLAADLLKERNARLSRIFEAVHKKDVLVIVVNFVDPKLSDAETEALKRHKNIMAILEEPDIIMAILAEHDTELLTSGQLSQEDLRNLADVDLGLTELSDLPDATEL